MLRVRMKQACVVFLVSVLALANGTAWGLAAASGRLDRNQDVRGQDLSAYDLRDQEDLLNTLTFDTQTRWPSADRLPASFSPEKLLEYGKDPGLKVRRLHQMGFTGKGVSVAYIDQPLLTTHAAYWGKDIHYYKIRPQTPGMETSMHGPAVTSLLVGKDIGVAPDVRLYYFGHPAWLLDQTTHAEALHKLLEVNESLPPAEKIRVVGFSDGPDPREKNIDAYRAAIQETEKRGVMVFDVTTFRLVGLTIAPFNDKEDPQSYEVTPWARDFPAIPDAFYVPVSARTTASGAPAKDTNYAYWTDGGLSWAVPYIVGTVALGLQVDPTLTKDQAIAYLLESAYPFHGGKMINPEGFVHLVQQNRRDKDYVMYLLAAVGVLILAAALTVALLPSLVEKKLNSRVSPPPYPASPEAKEMHQSLFVADMHADSLMFSRDLLRRGAFGHVDIPRLVEGNVGLQVFTVVTQANASMSVDRNKARDSITLLAMVEGWPVKTWGSLRERALYQARKFETLGVRSRGQFSTIHSQPELAHYLQRRQTDKGLTAGILGLEGAQALEGQLENVDVLYGAGFRMIGPTHFFDNELGGSAHGESKAGLTEFGRRVIRRMEDLHITADLAHASEEMIDDILDMATRPVVVSHTGVKGTADNNRNLSDEQIRRIAQTGGVIGIGFWSTATGGEDAQAIARAIHYAADIVGIDHVGLGSDFDGSIRQPFDATGLVQITEALMAEGFSADEIGRIMGGNVLRVFKANLPLQ